MSEAYSEAAARLTLDMLEIAAEVLELDPAEESIRQSDYDPFCLEIDAGRGRPFPIMSLSTKPYRRKGPGSALKVLDRALRLLVRARLWRELETPGPPAGLMKTNFLATMILHRFRIDPQEFVDAVWREVWVGDKYSDATAWRSQWNVPKVMWRSPPADRPIEQLPEGLPWMSGFCLNDEIYVDAVEILPFGVLHRTSRFGPTELRLPNERQIGTRTVLPPIGSPIRNFGWQDIIDKAWDPLLGHDTTYDGLVSGTYAHSTRVRLGGNELWQGSRFSGQDGDEMRKEFNIRLRRLFMRRARIQALIDRHLSPFAGPARD